MPSANKMTTPVAIDLPMVQGRYTELEDYTVGFEAWAEDADLTPLFRGLPDDRCQCAHWGVVQSGQITFRWADREETYGAGDAYFAPPGHVPVITAGTNLVEFSPTEELNHTIAVVEGNLETAGIG
ncbi:cupin domain-containing protein [Nocardioides stalactiti]|uniref:cupin domain-containing protein n=1 Tax=Nocardioides stalactiti TaxID=2755356 RepID=UPI0015FF1049|nr:cupin domain-containing protein [Nocardioides stalactiti]